MSYQVLARKWRPRTFEEVAGQEHVLRALINALDNDRLHHAYLFTGTRGVGKTTLARILAKCLNCEQGVSSNACGECAACQEINEGRFIDLIEVDAASRTKVEDTRELLENVQYMPTRGRYKVYLIDEVHMLSSHSFNALLKTLEEPPPHVKFLLATTDPQKLPVTVLSRCLQFNLKNLSPERIVEHLRHVLEEERVPFEEGALWALARAADGSMRDALSLTDQAVAHGDGKLTEEELRAMLGSIDRGTVLDLCNAVAEGDATRTLAVVDRLAEHAPDYAGALAEMVSVWHRVAVTQAVPGALDNSLGDQDQIQTLAQNCSREDVQLYYQICLLGRRDLPLAPDPRGGLEMVLLRQLAFQPQVDAPMAPPLSESGVASGSDANAENETEPRGGIEALKKSEPGPIEAGPELERQRDTQAVERAEQASGIREDVPPGVKKPVPVNAAANSATANREMSVKAVAPAFGDSEEFGAARWLTLCYELGLEGRLLNVASNLELMDSGGGKLCFRLDPAQSALYSEDHQAQLAQALSDYLHRQPRALSNLEAPVVVSIQLAPVSAETPQLHRLRMRAERQAAAVQAMREDPLVKALEERFGATLLEETVIPIDNMPGESEANSK
ncbi:MAG TPA: DNA polymerase III subunit gamma/tau [Porticoccaceae bacterium]|nr:DNA polymerase III subunit gamma/tau [Porticoccaceae bacterium]